MNNAINADDMSKFVDGKKNFWGVSIADDNNMQICKFHVDRKGRLAMIPVQYDMAFGLLACRNDDQNVDIVKFFNARNAKPIFEGPRYMTGLQFATKPSHDFIVICGENTIDQSQIIRLSFYARTDIGSMVVSFCTAYKGLARPLVVMVSKDNKVNQLMQQFVFGWMCEIVHPPKR